MALETKLVELPYRLTNSTEIEEDGARFLYKAATTYIEFRTLKGQITGIAGYIYLQKYIKAIKHSLISKKPKYKWKRVWSIGDSDKKEKLIEKSKIADTNTDNSYINFLLEMGINRGICLYQKQVGELFKPICEKLLEIYNQAQEQIKK